MTVAFIIEFILVISGNAVVVAVFTRTRELRQRKYYWPTTSLAAADLLVGALGGPSWLYSGLAVISDLWEWKPQVFLITSAVFQFVSYASLINLMVVALERAYATLWPLKHRVLSTRSYHVMLWFAWTLPLFFPLLDLAGRRGFISAVVFKLVWIACNWLLLTIILVCYVSIWIKIKFYQHPQNHVTTAQERKLTASLFLATASTSTSTLWGSRNGGTHLRKSFHSNLVTYRGSLYSFSSCSPSCRTAVLIIYITVWVSFFSPTPSSIP